MLKVFWVNLVAGGYCIRGDVHAAWVGRVRGEQWALLSFLIFNDEVNGCEFLGIRDETGGSRLFVEHHGGSGKPPEQTVTYTERTLCGSLDSAGLLQWLVFATVPKESPSYLPIPRVSHRGVFTYWCVLVSPFSSVSSVYKTAGCLIATKWCRLPVKFSTTQAPLKSKGCCCCLCSEKMFEEWVSAHFISFCPVSASVSSVITGVFFVRLDFWLGVKAFKAERFHHQLAKMSGMPINMFLIRAVGVQVSPAMFYWLSGNLFD